MKIHYFLFIVLISIGSSCVKTSESENSNYTEYSVEVEISESDSSYFEKSILIDLSSNEFIVENFSNVVGYRIAEIKFDLSNFNGNANAKGDFEIGFSQYGQWIGNPMNINQIDLKEFSDQSDFLYINLAPETISLAQESMNKYHMISLDLKGNVSAKPVSFTTTFFVTIIVRSN